MADVVLRPMTRDDVALLGEWLREPLVETWWHDDPSPEALERQYGRDLDGGTLTRLRIAVVDGEPAGFVQWYPFADEPEYFAELTPAIALDPGAWSLDYLIGRPGLRRRGIGTAMVRAACAGAWADGATELVVPVHEGNLGSQRVLERAGFALVGPADLTPDNPAHTRRHLVYRLTRPSAADTSSG